MKKNVIVLLAFVMIVGSSMAQNLCNKAHSRKQCAKMENPEMLAKKMTNKMVQKLSLNEIQAKELLKINMQFTAERFKNKQQMMELHKAQKAAMKEFVGKRDVQLKSILTPEQYKEFQACKMAKLEKCKKAKDCKMDKKCKKANRSMCKEKQKCCTK